MSALDTRQSILDAAERLFARNGFAATSLRQIIAEAGVNLASIHYHFRSKSGLIEAVFSRRIGPLNQERLRLLDAVENAASGGTLPVEDVLKAFVGPALRLSADPLRGGPDFMRLLGRAFLDPEENLQQMLFRLFETVAQRFIRAFRRALPQLPATEVFWRMHFAVGAMAHTMAEKQSLEFISGGAIDAGDVECSIQRLVSFLTGGMLAPVPDIRTSAGFGRQRSKNPKHIKRRHSL